MTYLDPHHAQHRHPLGRWSLRVLLVAGLLGFGWFALTVGGDANGRPEIVQEPMAGTF